MQYQVGDRIEAAAIRYVKLGPKSGWEAASLDEDRIYFGWPSDPFNLANQGDWQAVREHYLAIGQSTGSATQNKREIETFYTMGADCLWISFARGHLWWGFAEPEVHALPGRLPDGRQHYRRMMGQWRSTDITGRRLRIDQLSTKLTKVAAYRRTICRVPEQDYLLRVLNAQPNTQTAIVQSHRDALAEALVPLFRDLHQSDFELFVDLLLARSGWHRVSALGGLQRSIDLIVESAASGQRMAVQVKSEIDPAGARRCAEQLRSLNIADQLLIASHSTKGNINEPGVQLWDGPALARRAVDHGLTGWLIEHAR